MASCLDPELTCVVWKIEDGIPSVQVTKTSKLFLLFGSERHFEFKLATRTYNNNNKTSTSYYASLYLKPQYDFAHNSVQIMSFVINNGSNLYTCDKRITDRIHEIWEFYMEGYRLPVKECEIVCLFRCVFPFGQNRPTNETIRLTSGDSCLASLTSDLGQFLEEKTFPDVTLKCSNGNMSAHRSVLAARSSVFAAMFKHEMAERENGVVEIGEIDLSSLELFIKYVYTGRVTDLSENTVSTLFSMGDKYSMKHLQELCSKWICKNMTRKNYISYLQLADAHNYEDLKDSVVNFMIRDCRLLKSNEWSEFKELNPKLALFFYERYFDLMPKQ